MCKSYESKEQVDFIGLLGKVFWRKWVGKEVVQVEKFEKMIEVGSVQEVDEQIREKVLKSYQFCLGNGVFVFLEFV